MTANGQSIQRRVWRAEHMSREIQKHAKQGNEPQCLLQPRPVAQAEWILLRMMDAPSSYIEVAVKVWKSIKHALNVQPWLCKHPTIIRARNLLATCLQTTYPPPTWKCDIRDVPAYYHFTPRPDNVPEMDEQTSFIYSCDTGVSFCLGGNGAGCLGAEQKVYDPVRREYRVVSEIDGPFHVWARTSSGDVVIAEADKPRVYGTEDLYRVTLSNGQQITVTLGHRVLTESGWRELGDIVRDAGLLLVQGENCNRKLQPSSGVSESSCDRNSEVQLSELTTIRQNAETSVALLASCRPDCIDSSSSCGQESTRESGLGSEHSCECVQCARRLWQTASGCLGDCSPGSRRCGEQLLHDSDICQSSLPSRDDVASLYHCWQQMGVVAYRREYIRGGPCEDLRSSSDCVNPAHQSSSIECAVSAPYSQSSDAAYIHSQDTESSIQSTVHCISDWKSPEASCFSVGNTQSCVRLATVSASSQPPVNTPVNRVIITSVEFLRRDEYWDFSVSEHENYWMAGTWHHNTTTSSLLKACKFMLETPPPRRNTPFWFIAESYEQIGSIYDEKIAQFGLIPNHLIDHDRIHWNKRNNNWPFRVPLVSPEGPGGRNWTLEFKGWRQGRGQFQARAIGGFCFIEQFPWMILDETLRGAREFNIPGSKIAEYTPVDPSMSIEIEEMLENGYDPGIDKRTKRDGRYLPEGWKVYHMNTKCAMEAGHVSAAWFKEFFGMVPDSMLDVRMKGLFASFEGVIYPEFMPQIHCVGDEIWPIIHSDQCYHLRGIDWGAGPDNPFVCLWVAMCNDGSAYVYDEYYSNSPECTTIDHLVNVQEQWDWSNSPNFGMTYADPSDPDNFRIASRLSEFSRKHVGKAVPNISMGRAKNAVYEGIEHVRLLLKPSLKRIVTDPTSLKTEEKMCPRLYIHRGNCPNLIREMKSYRWMAPGDSIQAINPRNAPHQPCKHNDHACVTGETLVTMADGSLKRIDQIQAGEFVMSHLGASEVLDADCTGVRPVVSVSHECGRIYCTADHPFLLHTLRYAPASVCGTLFVYSPSGITGLCALPGSGNERRSLPVQIPVSGSKCLSVRETGNTERVYNLRTIDGTYFANGVLSSNCDALRYALFTYGYSHGITIDAMRRNSEMRDKTEEHYAPTKYRGVTELHRR